MSLLGWIKYLELFTAIIGTIYFYKYSHSILKYFLYMLWIVVGLEFVIWTLKQYYGIVFQNNFIYNVLTSLQYVYYFILYYKIMKTEKYKHLVLYFLALFLLGITVNFLFMQKLMVTAPFHSYSFTVGAILLIATIGIFFFEVLNTEKVLYFKRYLMFWISVALVLYYTSIIPFVISLNFLPALLTSDSLTIIFFTLNFMMYVCISIGFIVSRSYSD